MIVFDHVSKVYPNGTVGLDDVCLRIDDGEFVAIIGRSGAGKSTLLRAVNRMHQITSGTLRVSEIYEQAKKLQAEEQERADSEIAKTASEYDAKLKEALAAIDKKACAVSDALDVQSEQNRAKWAQVLADRAVNAD